MSEEIAIPWDAIIICMLSIIYGLYAMIGNLYAGAVEEVLVYVIYAICAISSALFGWLLTRRMESE
ncbi:MAG: hypothetical protein NDF54_08795 [archaeon GB-1867-035]|nr:hypothetical protein [Candidatus Culexmicrobium profundum]